MERLETTNKKMLRVDNRSMKISRIQDQIKSEWSTPRSMAKTRTCKLPEQALLVNLKTSLNKLIRKNLRQKKY